MANEILEIPEGTVELVENGGVDINAGEIASTGQHSAADVAAAFFRLNAPKFKELLTKMAPYQIRNALMNAVTYPFTDTEYNPETEEERSFAYLVHEMLLNRTIMQLSFEMDKAEQDLKKQEEASKLTEENKEGSV